jgi:hypothetical protein
MTSHHCQALETKSAVQGHVQGSLDSLTEAHAEVSRVQGESKALEAQMKEDCVAMKGFLRVEGYLNADMANLLYPKGMCAELTRLRSGGGGRSGGAAVAKEVEAAAARVAHMEARAVAVSEAVRAGERSMAELTDAYELERRGGVLKAGKGRDKMGAPSGKQLQQEGDALMCSVMAKREEVAMLQRAAAARATQAAGSVANIKSLKAANEALKVIHETRDDRV